MARLFRGKMLCNINNATHGGFLYISTDNTIGFASALHYFCQGQHLGWPEIALNSPHGGLKYFYFI